MSSAVAIDCDEALMAEPVILKIIAALEGPGKLDPRGLAQARTLLTDGNSGTYTPSSPGELRDSALAVLARLTEADPARYGAARRAV
jgi:hypothetical protein